MATESFQPDYHSDGKQVRKSYIAPLASGLRKRRRVERVVTDAGSHRDQKVTGRGISTSGGGEKKESNAVAEEVDGGPMM